MTRRKRDVENLSTVEGWCRVYVSGAMSGQPDNGFPVFEAATADLRARGFDVVSPAERDLEQGIGPDARIDSGSLEWARLVAEDLKVVADPTIEAIVVLPGWEQSRGARLEVHVGRELGKDIYLYDRDKRPLEKVAVPRERPLEEALRLVHGNRGADYGHPGDDFARSAGMWRALFGWDVEAKDVALAMVCVKLSRLRQTPSKRDSVTDIAGYAEAYWMVIERAKRTTVGGAGG